MKALVLSILLLAAAPALAQKVSTPRTHSSSSGFPLVAVAMALIPVFLATQAAAKKKKQPQQ
jgi:hypothetical protein